MPTLVVCIVLMDYNSIQMGKLKKPVMVIGALLIAVGVAAALYLLVIKKDTKKTTTNLTANNQANSSDNAPVDYAKELASVNGVYSDAESVKFTGAATGYFAARDFTKMDDVLNKISDTAKLSVIGIKYKLLTSKYLLKSETANYLKAREEYKAILKTRSATDKVAKQILTDFDNIYPIDTSPKVTYPEGEEVR